MSTEIVDMGADARTLVERIDAGEVDPESVDVRPFVEDDDKVLTPALAERLPDDKVDRYNDLVAERDQRELRDEGKLTAEQEQALDLLEDPDDEKVADVELGQATVQVKTEIGGDVEDKVERVMDSDDRHQNADVAIDVICHMVQDDKFSQRELWEAYRDKHGTAQLMIVFMEVLEPFLDRIENEKVVQKFREIEG